jgi:hypothetical protein
MGSFIVIYDYTSIKDSDAGGTVTITPQGMLLPCWLCTVMVQTAQYVTSQCDFSKYSEFTKTTNKEKDPLTVVSTHCPTLTQMAGGSPEHEPKKRLSNVARFSAFICKCA